jgi:hypothetical protein
MNVTEMHIAVQQGVDKIHSLQADSLLSEEIDIELNKNMMRFINTKYGRNNMYRKGFEESQKRIDDLRTLVVEYEAPVSFKEILKPDSIFVDTFQLPSDYMYLVNQFSRLWINNCQPIGYGLEGTNDIAYLVLDLNSFVCNNAAGTSTAFVGDITMVNDVDDLTSGQANIWSPSFADPWTPSVYPSDIEAVKQDILANPGVGFEIYWEEFQTLNYPNSFIVVVDTETHDWFNSDPSLGAITQAMGRGYGGAGDVYSPALLMDTTYTEKRVPDETSDRLMASNKFSQQDDIFTLLTDPFNTTKYTSPLTTIRGRAIDVYTSDIFIIDTLKITYIRRPMEISLSLGVDCELPEHTHQEIVSMAVSSILEEISDPRYKTAAGEVSRNE